MVEDRVGHDSLLDQAEEQLPPVARTAAIETERELVEIIIKMHLRDRTLMRPEQPTFEQRDDPVHTRQLGDGQLSIASHQDSLMAIAIRFQPIVPMPAVREYDAGGFDRVLNEGSETGGGRVGNTAHPHPSNATPKRSDSCPSPRFVAEPRRWCRSWNCSHTTSRETRSSAASAYPETRCRR